MLDKEILKDISIRDALIMYGLLFLLISLFCVAFIDYSVTALLALFVVPLITTIPIIKLGDYIYSRFTS